MLDDLSEDLKNAPRLIQIEAKYRIVLVKIKERIFAAFLSTMTLLKLFFFFWPVST